MPSMARALCSVLAAACLASCTTPDDSHQTSSLSATDEAIRWSGRIQRTDEDRVRFGYPAVHARVRISGGNLSVRAKSSSNQSYLGVSIDDGDTRRIRLSDQWQTYSLTEAEGQQSLQLIHLSETWHGVVTLDSFQLQGGRFLSSKQRPQRKLLVIGDSVTCGESVNRPQTGQCNKTTRWWDPEHSYGMLLGERLNAQTQLVCYGGRGLIRSWNGERDELQAPSFFERTIAHPDGPAYPPQAYVPDLILISLGTNDFSLGIGPLPERNEFVDAYVAFVRRLLKLYPDTRIALTEGAMVNDQDDPSRPQRTRLRQYISATVERLGSERVRAVRSGYYPGDDCDAHPTGAQHRAMAQELAPKLIDLIAK